MIGESIGSYLDRLGSREPTPGGGSAACLCGAVASSLGRMVVDVAALREPGTATEDLRRAFDAHREEFLRLAGEDETAFRSVMAALRLPKTDPRRSEAVQDALEAAARPPLRAAEAAAALLDDLSTATAFASRHIASDVVVAAHIALACLRASVANVEVNLKSLRPPERRAAPAARCAELLQEGAHVHAEVLRRAESPPTAS
ncbi:MAG: cyclodeaminase/cyclohydrolase family protein [Candidatus Bipolaricaulota bacterium]